MTDLSENGTRSDESGDALAQTALRTLARLVKELEGGDERAGQQEMCEAVARSISQQRHLLVEAGTGTGKSLAYLVAAACARQRVVVVTATKALQEQLVGKDLPFVVEHLGRPLTFALLKGRSNYLCLARMAEVSAEQGQTIELLPSERDDISAVSGWVGSTETGDRADLPHAVSDRLWSELSVDSRECPGRARCEHGEACFAEQARDRAGEADVVVVNAALYGRDLESNGAVLCEHEVVVIDEAHTLEDFAADAFGEELGPGRIRHLAGSVRRLFVADATEDPAGDLEDWADRLERILGGLATDAPLELDAGTRDALAGLEGHLGGLAAQVGRVEPAELSAAQTKERVAKLVTSARIDVQSMLRARAGEDALWVEASRSGPVLHSTAVDIGAELAERLFSRRTVILTSATLSAGGDFSPLAWRLGLRPERDDQTAGESPADQEPGASPGSGNSEGPAAASRYVALDVGSPFDFRKQAVLYIGAHLPDPRADTYEAAMLDEVEALVRAAGGRTLGLCTSLRSAEAIRARLRDALDVRVLAPDDMPRPLLMKEFANDETSCLVGSLGLWQGIDVPGPALSLVVIDKIPFARPNDPYAVARREHAASRGHDPFLTFDVPRAAMMLAQGSGRLVRRREDRGVVAVLDPRLLTKRYGATLVDSLPPMFRMTDPHRVIAALERLRDTNGD